MSQMDQLAEHYRQVSGNLRDIIKPFESEPFPAHLGLTQKVVSREALPAELDALVHGQDLEGWVLWPSELRILRNEAPVIDTPIIELVVKTPEATVQIRHHHGDQWHVQRATVRPAAGEAANVLAESCTHLAVRPELGRLRFLRLWGLDEHGTLRLLQSVFDGFEGGAA